MAVIFVKHLRVYRGQSVEMFPLATGHSSEGGKSGLQDLLQGGVSPKSDRHFIFTFIFGGLLAFSETHVNCCRSVCSGACDAMLMIVRSVTVTVTIH